MRWEDLYDDLYDADDRTEIERLKTLAAKRSEDTPPSSGPQRPGPVLRFSADTRTRQAVGYAWSSTFGDELIDV